MSPVKLYGKNQNHLFQIEFERKVIDNTVEKLIKGDDYREEVVNSINAAFFDFAINFFKTNLIDELKQDSRDEIGISIKLTYHDVHVELNLAESLLVINALATKKVAIRGGAWSSIGKKVEKPLVTKLCEICEVSKEYMDDSTVDDILETVNHFKIVNCKKY